ncbi:MAG TPA: hypothetical protein VGM12_22470 [Trebonia sp.]|jgi:hypothetical protein
MARVSWTREDDLLVCTSYLANGTSVTDALRAAVPAHEAGSIGMRLQNFEYLATDGASGLANTAAQTREVWDTVQRLRKG